MECSLNLEKRGPKAVKNKVVTFAHLADYCETEIYVQAEHNEEGEKTTFNQEIKLLRACQTEDRRHLRALIIVAVEPFGVDRNGGAGKLAASKLVQSKLHQEAWVHYLQRK